MSNTQNAENNPSAGPVNEWQVSNLWGAAPASTEWINDRFADINFAHIKPEENPHCGQLDLIRQHDHEELYSKDRTLGRGGEGTAKVYAFKTFKHSRFVIKSMDNDFGQIKKTPNEIVMLKHLDELTKSELKHPHICYALHFWQIPMAPARYEIVMPYLSQGNLAQFKQLSLAMVPKLPEPLLLHYLEQMVSAVCFLHAHDIVHHDLKPENVMIELRNTEVGEIFDNITIIDLGLARFGTSPAKQKGGTAKWSPPEYPMQGSAADIFALGAIMHYLATPNGKVVRSSNPPYEISQQGINAVHKWYMNPNGAPWEIERFVNPANFEIISSIEEARELTYESTGAFKATGTGYTPLFECLVHRALDMNPQTRITAAALLAALEREANYQVELYKKFEADQRKNSSNRPMLKFCWGDIPPGWLPHSFH